MLSLFMHGFSRSVSFSVAIRMDILVRKEIWPCLCIHGMRTATTFPASEMKGNVKFCSDSNSMCVLHSLYFTPRYFYMTEEICISASMVRKLQLFLHPERNESCHFDVMKAVFLMHIHVKKNCSFSCIRERSMDIFL